MDFESSPEHDAARAAAERFCEEALPSLPQIANDFFREAALAMQKKGLYDEDSMALAARTAIVFGAASASLGLAYAGCHGYAWTLRRLVRNGRRDTSELAEDGTSRIGVITFGDASLSRVAGGSASKLTGRAPFVAGGSVASRLLLVTAPNARPGLIAVVDTTKPGVVREPFGGLGFERVPKCAFHFDETPVEQCSATDGSEEGAIRTAWSAARVLAAALAVGIGRRAFHIALAHLRAVGHRPSQSTEFSLSDVATDLDAAELSVLRAAWAIDRSSRHGLESASAKLLAARAATRAAHSALALTGSAGYTDDLRECYLDAGALESYVGSIAEHEGTIASAMLEES